MPPAKRTVDPFNPDEWLRFFKKFFVVIVFMTLCTIALFAWGFVELISWITSK